MEIGQNLNKNNGFYLFKEINLEDSNYLSFGAINHVCFMYTSIEKINIDQIYQKFQETFTEPLKSVREYINYRIEKEELDHILFAMIDHIREHETAFMGDKKVESRKELLSELRDIEKKKKNYDVNYAKNVVEEFVTEIKDRIKLENNKKLLEEEKNNEDNKKKDKDKQRKKSAKKLAPEEESAKLEERYKLSQNICKNSEQPLKQEFSILNQQIKDKFSEISSKYHEKDPKFLDYIKMYEEKRKKLMEAHKEIATTVSYLMNRFDSPLKVQFMNYPVPILNADVDYPDEKDKSAKLGEVKPGLIEFYRAGGVQEPNPQD